MSFPVNTSMHLVKGEDLNHHGTLYAGRSAEWFVESGFISAAMPTRPENIVCVKIHGMTFSRPIQKGEVVTFMSHIVKVGRTKIIVLIEAYVGDQIAVRGFMTFVHVDLQGTPMPHGLELTPETDEEKAVFEEASKLV